MEGGIEVNAVTWQRVVPVTIILLSNEIILGRAVMPMIERNELEGKGGRKVSAFTANEKSLL